MQLYIVMELILVLKIILNANLTQTSDGFYVGQNWGDYFDGKIDEAIAFNRTLSPTEIKAFIQFPK